MDAQPRRPRFLFRFAAGAVLLASLCAVLPAQAQGVPGDSRGKLLYETHCIACHSTQMHWRESRLATNWEGLKYQVRRWQATAGLQWNEQDVADVARHLNDTIYQFPQATGRLSAPATK